MMFTKIIICFITFTVVTSQISGEFWWLNDKLAKLNNVEPLRPKFEDVGEFDTDESAKVVFRDNHLYYIDKDKYYETTTGKTEAAAAIIYFRDNSKLISPLNVSYKPVNAAQNNDGQNKRRNETKNYNGDVFNFLFPSNGAAIFKNTSVITTSTSTTLLPKKNSTEVKLNKPEVINDKILFDTNKEESLSEKICTYMKKTECSRCNGIPYTPENKFNNEKQTINSQQICCILPLSKEKMSKISFPNSITYKNNRIKRSPNGVDMSPALKQRNALMQRKYRPHIHDTQPTASTIIYKSTRKIVTPNDEYIDPYLNIKNSNFNRPDKQQDYEAGSSQQDKDYIYNDYYAVELPKPGLVGLYSDHRPSTWSFVNANKGSSYDNVNSNEEDIESSGYSTIDPRQGVSTTSTSNFKRRLLKLTTSSVNMQNAESQTVSYLSNPDFQVLQRFKLLNLMDNNKHRPKRILRKTTTSSLSESGEDESNFELNTNNDYDDYIEISEQVYKECGRTKEGNGNYNCDTAIGEASRGAHPWILFAVLTKRQQSILCYATLVHPRAAVTAADCTYGITPGEITIVAGVWDLKEDNAVQSQRRLASAHIHQQYVPGKLAYNVALLHWRRPLKLDPHVQPACLTDAGVGDDCMLVGWGGYDQAIRQRPRWQRATTLSSKNCDERITAEHAFDLPIDAFCAYVDSKTTVTGLGGPLMCKAHDVFSLAGVAVWRDDVIVLMRAQEWVTRAMISLRIH